MSRKACAVLSMAAFGLSTPVLACPWLMPCIPQDCVPVGPAPVAGIDRGGSSSLYGPENFASRNMSLLSQVTLAQMGGGAGSSLYAWVDPLTKREYAIMGRSTGTSFIDVTNPTSPVIVGTLPRVSGTVATSWREPKVYQNTVYVGVDGTSVGMQVMDLTKLRNYSGTTLNLAADSVYNNAGTLSISRIHTLAINQDTGYLYAAGTNRHSGGLHIIDVNNPTAPTYAGAFSGDGYTHETQVVVYNGPDDRYRGKELAFNSNGKQGTTVNHTFSILDLTNKSNVTRISAATYPNARYIHQGWLTEDHRFFFMNDELDEPNQTGGKTRTHLWDVSNLESPIYKGFWDNTTTSIDHNLYVKGNYVYQSNYTTGIRVLKIGDLESGDPSQWLTEVAWFDTYIPNDGSSFNGAWNNYPYLPSGNILVSDINGGLFVLSADLPDGGPGKIGVPRIPNGTILIPEPAFASVVLGAMMLLPMRRRR